MKNIDETLVKRFAKLTADRLSGKWVIIGGSVLPLMGAGHRVTNDIDLAGPKQATQGDMIRLYEIAEELGLPIEAVNQAASFFIQKIPGWEKNLVAVCKGTKGVVFRPTVRLFVELKIRRLSETDLADCIKMLDLETLPREDGRDLVRQLGDLARQEKNEEKLNRSSTLLSRIEAKQGKRR